MIEMTKLEPQEAFMTYTFPDGQRVVLKDVTHFLSRQSGVHRLRTADGRLYIVPVGWIHIEIEATEFTV